VIGMTNTPKKIGILDQLKGLLGSIFGSKDNKKAPNDWGKKVYFSDRLKQADQLAQGGNYADAVELYDRAVDILDSEKEVLPMEELVAETIKKMNGMVRDGFYRSGQNMAILDLIVKQANEGKIVVLGGNDESDGQKFRIADLFKTYQKKAELKVTGFTHLALDLSEAELNLLERYCEKLKEAEKQKIFKPGMFSIDELDNAVFSQLKAEMENTRFKAYSKGAFYSVFILVKEAKKTGLTLVSLGREDQEMANKLIALNQNKRDNEKILVLADNRKVAGLEGSFGAQLKEALPNKVYTIFGLDLRSGSGVNPDRTSEKNFFERYFGNIGNDIALVNLAGSSIAKLKVDKLYPDVKIKDVEIGQLFDGFAIVGNKRVYSTVEKAVIAGVMIIGLTLIGAVSTALGMGHLVDMV